MIFTGTPKTASAQSIGISVSFGPPPIPYYIQPQNPEPNYIWSPGYWGYDPNDGYYWVPGTWVPAPQYGYLWTPGYWLGTASRSFGLAAIGRRKSATMAA